MIEFYCRNKDKNRVPIMRAREMDELAEMLIKDYRPALLKEPQPIDYEHFLQFYLGVDLQYQDITADESILGMTSFDDGETVVYDTERHCDKNINVTEGTVIIDNHLLASEKAGRLRFTALHEGGGHWWCHRGVYAKDKRQLFRSFMDDGPRSIRCRRSTIENFAYRKLTTSDDWMEYQADYMASAIAMPKTTFKIVAEQILYNAGIKDKRIVIGINSHYDMCAVGGFCSQVARVFQVSRKAAEIKLKNFGYIIDVKTIS